MKEKTLTLVFEGVDGSGKSTLISALKAMSQFKNIDFKDRGTISERVYAIKFDRTEVDGIPIDIQTSYWEYWLKHNTDTRIILCNPSVKTLAQRCLEKNEDFCRNRSFEDLVDYLARDKSLFETIAKDVASFYEFKFLELDTDKNIVNSISKIKEFLQDAKF